MLINQNQCGKTLTMHRAFIDKLFALGPKRLPPHNPIRPLVDAIEQTLHNDQPYILIDEEPEDTRYTIGVDLGKPGAAHSVRTIIAFTSTGVTYHPFYNQKEEPCQRTPTNEPLK